MLEKTLESPLGSEEIQPVHPKRNQSWIFIGRTDAEAETPIFGHLMWRTDSFEKTLRLGKIEGRRRRGWQRMRRLDGITDSMNMSLSRFQELVTDRESWCAAVHGIPKGRTQLSNWTELNWTEHYLHKVREKPVSLHSLLHISRWYLPKDSEEELNNLLMRVKEQSEKLASNAALKNKQKN